MTRTLCPTQDCMSRLRSPNPTWCTMCAVSPGSFSSSSLFRIPLYLVLHGSDSNDTKSTMVLQTVPRHAHVLIALVPRSRMLIYSCLDHLGRTTTRLGIIQGVSLVCGALVGILTIFTGLLIFVEERWYLFMDYEKAKMCASFLSRFSQSSYLVLRWSHCTTPRQPWGSADPSA